jgi:transposase
LKSALLESAWAAGRTRTFLGSKFWSVAGRKGNKRAVVVVAHKILVIAYHVLKSGTPYNELGTDFLEKRKSISTEELMIRRLEKQGYLVTRSESHSA